MSYKRNRSRKAITLNEARLRMTDAIKAMEQIILENSDEAKVTNAANCLSGLISRYAKLVEVHDLEKRISELEKQHKMRKVS